MFSLIRLWGLEGHQEQRLIIYHQRGGKLLHLLGKRRREGRHLSNDKGEDRLQVLQWEEQQNWIRSLFTNSHVHTAVQYNLFWTHSFLYRSDTREEEIAMQLYVSISECFFFLFLTTNVKQLSCFLLISMRAQNVVIHHELRRDS